MVPPREALIADHQTGTEVDDGLGVRPHVALTHADAELVHRRGPFGTFAADTNPLRVDAGNPFRGCRGRRTRDQPCQIVVRLADGDPATDECADVTARGRDRHLDQRLAHHARNAQYLAARVHTQQQDAELVLVDVPDDVDRPREARHPARKRAHHRRAAEDVEPFDRVVHVHDRCQDERARVAVASGGCQREPHTLVECRPREQPGGLVHVASTCGRRRRRDP